MQKSIITLFITLLLCRESFSQINVQSGSAQFDIPIFNFSDSKSGLSHQVSIGYSSGNGLKVNDLPSGIGQGWQLICGGSVTRKQNGEPDDQNSIGAFPTVAYNNNRVFNQQIAIYDDNYQSFSYTGDCYSRYYIDNYYPNGYLYSEFPLDITESFPLNAAAPRELSFLPRFKGTMDKRFMLSKRALADRQQDVFLFNVNGMSGQFVIARDGSSIVSMLDSKIKIEKTESDMTGSNIRTRINSFKITDGNGIIYTFGAMSLSEVLKPQTLSFADGDFSFSTSGSDGIGKYTVDQWGITSIKNPFTNEEITFNYIETDVDYVAQKLPSYQIMENDTKENVNLHEVRVKGKVKNLQSINFPDGHSIYINYDGLRQDLGSDSRISDIQVKYNNSITSKFVFTHSYLFKKEIRAFTETFANADKRFLRLSLTAVQKQGPDGESEPPYQFAYNTGSESTDLKDIVPPTDCYAQDHWGYYNKTSLVDIDQPIPTKEVLKDLMVSASTYRIPSSGMAKFGLIKMIKNPTGGEMSYEYEQNFELNSQSVTITTGGVHVSLIKQYDGIDHNHDIITNYSYVLENGNSSKWGYEDPSYNIRRQVQIYKDNLGYKFSPDQAINITGSLNIKLLDAAAKLEKIRSKINTIKTIYNLIAAKPLPSLAYGPQIIIWGYTFAISKTIEFLFLNFDPYDYDYSNTYQFYPLNYSNPVGNHFSRIVISNNTVGNGKVVQEFSKPTNFSTEIASNNFPYSDKQRFAPWKFDQLIKETVFNSANSPIAETFYNYNIVENQLNNSNFLSCKVEPNYLRSARCEAATYNFPISDLATDFYYPITGRTEMTSTIKKNYTSTGIVSQTNASVQYNNDYLPSITTTTKSNGDQIINKTYYTNDYNSSVSTAIAALKTANAITIPVSTETWLKKAVSNDEFLINATVNEFVVLPNNDIKVAKVYTLEAKEPLAKSQIGDWSSTSLIRTSLASYVKVQSVLDYNSGGSLAQSTSKGHDVSSNLVGGEISSAVYDYNERFVVAAVSNAAVSSVAYTSFEADNGTTYITKNGWTYHVPSILTGVDFCPTGDKCYSLTLVSATISSTITIDRDYILSFWAKADAGMPVVHASSTLLKSVTINGWTYYEYKINQGSASPYLSGPGIIDEIRLYPNNAKMATTTYDPVKGKTSECDINNRIVYYEYDSLGRIVRVRDEKRNLVKTYEYHFKN